MIKTWWSKPKDDEIRITRAEKAIDKSDTWEGYPYWTRLRPYYILQRPDEKEQVIKLSPERQKQYKRMKLRCEHCGLSMSETGWKIAHIREEQGGGIMCICPECARPTMRSNDAESGGPGT